MALFWSTHAAPKIFYYSKSNRDEPLRKEGEGVTFYATRMTRKNRRMDPELLRYRGNHLIVIISYY